MRSLIQSAGGDAHEGTLNGLHQSHPRRNNAGGSYFSTPRVSGRVQMSECTCRPKARVSPGSRSVPPRALGKRLTRAPGPARAPLPRSALLLSPLLFLAGASLCGCPCSALLIGPHNNSNNNHTEGLHPCRSEVSFPVLSFREHSFAI